MPGLSYNIKSRLITCPDMATISRMARQACRRDVPKKYDLIAIILHYKANPFIPITSLLICSKLKQYSRGIVRKAKLNIDCENSCNQRRRLLEGQQVFFSPLRLFLIIVKLLAAILAQLCAFLGLFSKIKWSMIVKSWCQ